MKLVEKTRNPALDVIHITALYCVISVHFFKNNGFYNQTVIGERMYLMTVLRTMFMVCVPLFMILSGYLMNRKKLDKNYYKGIRRTVGIYILAGLACLGYQVIAKNAEFSAGTVIGKLLNFTAAPYAWYIEMYIGLYLLIPFLNLVYHNIEMGGAETGTIIDNDSFNKRTKHLKYL